MSREGHRIMSWSRATVVAAAAVLAAASLSVHPAQGAEDSLQVLPGHLIGKDYEADKFYVRQGDGEWELTYTPGWQGEGFSEEVRGTLPNLRAANGILDDEGDNMTDVDPDFTADGNTDEFISNLDSYREHGLIATDVNFQGGNAGIGVKNPAFESDGTLREEWKERAARVIEAHAERNMVVVLGLFYFRQDEVLEDEDAVRNAVTNATDWLIENNYRNVIIEIANEYNDDDSYDHDIIHTDEGMAELIRLAQSRFDDADFRLAVSASRFGDGSWPDGEVADAADLALLHCNGLDAEDCAEAAAEAQEGHDYPIVVNETDNTKGTYSDDTLEEDRRTIDEMTAVGASWGFMLNQWNQYASCVFHDDCGSKGLDWKLGSEPGANGEGEELLRNFAHGVFDHLEEVVFDKGE